MEACWKAHRFDSGGKRILKKHEKNNVQIYIFFSRPCISSNLNPSPSHLGPHSEQCQSELASTHIHTFRDVKCCHPSARLSEFKLWLRQMFDKLTGSRRPRIHFIHKSNVQAPFTDACAGWRHVHQWRKEKKNNKKISLMLDLRNWKPQALLHSWAKYLI